MPLGVPDFATLLAPRYRLIRELGGGTMATVWLAEDTRHGRQVAIKVLRPEQSASFAAERFLQEIEIAARLQHPHIVPLLDSGENGGLLFLVMPFIEGESLRQRLTRVGRLPVGEVIRILADVADALAYAHGKGVLHRDIKPDNILLAGRHALVTDFGVAKALSIAAASDRNLTGGLAIGTPAYMAPEQALAEPDLDPRVDLYALSVVGFELLTGAPPFDGPTAQAILTAQVLDPPPPLEEKRADTPPVLAALVTRGLAKLRDERWSSAEELVHALEPLATPSGGNTPAGVPPAERRAGRFWPMTAAVVLVSLAVGGYLLRPAPRTLGFTETQLTFVGSVRTAAISPDGQFVAFVSESAGSAWLMVQDTRGGRAIHLARAGRMGYLSWSGDGSEVRTFSYDDGASYLRMVPRLGGPSRVVPVGPWSMPSPDGRRVVDLPLGTPFLRIRELSTGDSLRVERDPGWWYSPPAWSADGQWIAAAAFRQGGSGARLIVISATDLHEVVALEDSVPIGSPTWDGRSNALYYLRGSGGLMDLYHVALNRDGQADGPPVLVRAGLAAGESDLTSTFATPVSVTADGSTLVYTQQREWSNLATVTFDDWRRGGAPTPLTTGSTMYRSARLSPDGRALAVIRSETDQEVLELLPFGPGAARQDIGRFHEGTGPTWSSDGKRVMIGVAEPPHGIGLRIFHLADLSGTTRYLGEVGEHPEWFDDSTVVSPRSGNRSFQLLPLARGTPRLLPGVDTVGWMLWPFRSPDGNLLAYSYNPGGGKSGLWLYDRPHSTSRELAAGAQRAVGWSRDSRTVYAVTSGTASEHPKVMALPLSGPPRELASFPDALEVLEVTADGQRAILNLRQRQADVWRMRFTAH